MDRIMAAQKRPDGPEWFNSAQYGNRYGISRCAALDRLKSMSREGILDHWKSHLKTGEHLFRIKPTK